MAQIVGAALERKIVSDLASPGFVFVRSADARTLIDAPLMWESYARSWGDLGQDRYMGDGGTYRRRRFATFALLRSRLTRNVHRPHYQDAEYNPLNGGVDRWFAPVTDQIGRHPLTLALFQMCRRVFDSTDANGTQFWHAEMHQFRIQATNGALAQPTPEGMHRDGVDFVMVMLVGRENVQSGTTMLFDSGAQPLGEFTLQRPLDMVFLDDRKVFHGVTGIQQLNPSAPGYRDVLVMTFKRCAL